VTLRLVYVIFRQLNARMALLMRSEPDPTDITAIRRDRLGGAIHEYMQFA